jgi:hypothetical protein
MKNKYLIKKTYGMLVFLFLASTAFAQSKINLYMGLGTGSIDNFDLGTVPYHIKGNSSIQDWGANIAWKRCQIQLDGRYFKSTLKTLSGTNQALDLNLEFLYRYHDTGNNRFHFHTGVALEGYGDIKSLPALQNASFCLNIFGNLCDVNMVQWDFAFNRAKTHPWLTAYVKLTLPIVGVVSRPGFSYTYDSQGMGVFSRLFAGHESFAKFFPGCSTDLGLWLNLKNNNRIGLNYRWDYLSTGKKGIWRYDNAYHSINLSFMFNIK